MDHRSPLESIFNVIAGLPQGHDKPIKHALYNALALFLLMLCSAAGYAVFVILEPFIKPLMWAVLVGSALHPLKRSLRYKFQCWFEDLEITNTPYIFAVILVPFNITNDLAEFLGQNLFKRIKILVGGCCVILLLHVFYNYTPRFVVGVTWHVAVNVFKCLAFFLENSNVWIILPLILGYLTLVFVLWKPENNTKFHYASILIWLLLSCCFSQQFSSLKIPVFVLLQTVFFGGFLSEVYEIYSAMNASGHKITMMECLSMAFHDKNDEIDDFTTNCDDDDKNGADEGKKNVETVEDDSKEPENCDPWSLELYAEQNKAGNLKIKKPKPILQRSLSQPYFTSQVRKMTILKGRNISFTSSTSLIDEISYESTFYLYAAFWLCIVMLFWKNVMLLPLLPLPILFYTIKHAGYYLGLWNYLRCNFNGIFKIIFEKCEERHDALVPVPVRGIYKIINKMNLILKNGIKNSIDTVSSCFVIFGLIIFVLCGSVFIVLQIYAETIMLVQMTGSVINQTVVHNPELRQILPPAWDDTVDSILDNAYQYGREGISKAVKSMTSDIDSSKSEKLEKQILELWDRVYQNWMSTNDSNGPKVTEDAVKSTWEEFVNDLQKSPEMFNINGLVDFGKQNLGTLMSLLESIWGILKGNISLILGSFSTFLSVILGGGTAVLNFILNFVVFLTTLFYLLNSSEELYKPVEILTNFSQSGRRFGHALEAAVNGVFMASFKMAAFYGMWTWFIHNLFGVKIVYLPSAFATILGAVPFLGTYWACIPAILDLWLAQDRGISAIIFAIFQFLPTSVVDTTIYKEIKGGGHPYLTGLAIAGGIFCLGVEGAIIGPMLLCGLYVAIDLSSSLFKESPSEESINLRLHRQLKD